jgi:hypothetical protein
VKDLKLFYFFMAREDFLDHGGTNFWTSARIPDAPPVRDEGLSTRDRKKLQALEGVINARFGPPVTPTSLLYSPAMHTSAMHAPAASSTAPGDLIEIGVLLSSHSDQIDEDIRARLKRKFNEDIKKKYLH